MVRTRITNSHSRLNRILTKKMIKDVFGRTLTISYISETVDAFGQLSALSSTEVEFTGDLQFGPDLDQKYVTTGIIEIGDAVLYIEPEALTLLPSAQDIISDSNSNSKWEIMGQIEAAELGGSVTHYSYRCKRLIEASDTRI